MKELPGSKNMSLDYSGLMASFSVPLAYFLKSPSIGMSHQRNNSLILNSLRTGPMMNIRLWSQALAVLVIEGD